MQAGTHYCANFTWACLSMKPGRLDTAVDTILDNGKPRYYIDCRLQVTERLDARLPFFIMYKFPYCLAQSFITFPQMAGTGNS